MHALPWCIYYTNHFLVLPSVPQVPQKDFRNREDSLESINMKRTTALVDGCLDELSHDSGRIKISDLNDVGKCPL